MSGPPYRRLNPPVPVLVTVPGVDEPYPGIAEGWRGDMVKVWWSSGVGLRHTGFVAASCVQRLEPPVKPTA